MTNKIVFRNQKGIIETVYLCKKHLAQVGLARKGEKGFVIPCTICEKIRESNVGLDNDR